MVKLPPDGRRRFRQTLEDAKRAEHESDLQQGKDMPNRKEVERLRSAFLALIQAVEVLARDVYK